VTILDLLLSKPRPSNFAVTGIIRNWPADMIVFLSGGASCYLWMFIMNLAEFSWTSGLIGAPRRIGVLTIGLCTKV